MFIPITTRLPEDGAEVMVKLANGHYSVAIYTIGTESWIPKDSWLPKGSFSPANVFSYDVIMFQTSVIAWKPIEEFFIHETEKNLCCKENMMPYMPMTGWKCRMCGRISESYQ